MNAPSGASRRAVKPSLYCVQVLCSVAARRVLLPQKERCCIKPGITRVRGGMRKAVFCPELTQPARAVHRVALSSQFCDVSHSIALCVCTTTHVTVKVRENKSNLNWVPACGSVFKSGCCVCCVKRRWTDAGLPHAAASQVLLQRRSRVGTAGARFGCPRQTLG